MARDRGPIEEPQNSTVNDWHGQKVADDMALADELLEETGGDVEEAERRFEQRSAAHDPERDISRPKSSQDSARNRRRSAARDAQTGPPESPESQNPPQH